MIIFLDDGSSQQTDSLSAIIEPELPPITISLEDTDFKAFQYEIWSNQFLEKINITIPPYGYQRELVQNAIRAKNTIICLRTGGGKTFIAGLFCLILI
jgi:superfamily II DNA or RNA helicase